MKQHFLQETEYTCGPACFRMILSDFKEEEVWEIELERMMNTNEKTGTSHENLVRMVVLNNLSIW